jgi:hypothetical protein
LLLEGLWNDLGMTLECPWNVIGNVLGNVTVRESILPTQDGEFTEIVCINIAKYLQEYLGIFEEY